MRTTVLMLLLAVGVLAQVNLNFESGVPGERPEGWAMSSSVTSAPFQAKLTSQNCFQGQSCVELGGPPYPPSSAYGMLTQNISATPYLSRAFRLRAAIRADGSTGTYLRLWILATGPSGTLFNTSSEGFSPTEWGYRNLEVRVPANAVKLYFGFVCYGSGRTWVDDAALESFSPDDEPPRSLSENGLANLTAFAKVLGYVRHFHPSDQAAQTDWNSFAVRGVRAVEAADTPGELADALRKLFDPIAPTLRIYSDGNPPPLPSELQPASVTGLDLVGWKHLGVGLNTSTFYSSTRRYLSAETGDLPSGWVDPRQPYDAPIGRGLSVQVPLTVYRDTGGTMPHVAIPSSAPVWMSAGDRATRLAGVILAWNVAQHFYPYFDVVDTDWPAALQSALTSAAKDSVPGAYLKTLSRMVARLKDGHGSVSQTVDAPARSMVPLMWDWVEGQLIVTYVFQGQQQGIAMGDRVLKIDDQDVDAVISAQQEFSSGATPQWILYRTLNAIAYCNGGRMRLEIEPYAEPGASRTVEFSCTAPFSWREPRGDTVQEPEPGILYVDINFLTEDIWRTAVPRLAAAKGIVFDLRGYPQIVTWLQHLNPERMTSAQFHIPTPSKPDRVDMTFDRDPAREWTFMTPLAPFLAVPKAVLTDGSAISFAESEMGIVENYRLAEIVGATTAGTNGNVNSIELPGGFNVAFTGMKVLKHDGSQHHGVGIAPTVPVSRTRQGIAEGRDEILLRGIEVVKSRAPNAHHPPATSPR